MMNRQGIFHYSLLLLTLLFWPIIGMTGCEGDDGPSGRQGQPATLSVSKATSIVPTITSVSINSPPKVDFKLTNENATPLIGLSAGNISFSIARLVAGSNGGSSAWQNYLTLTEAAGGGGPGTTDQIQATTENGASGVLADHGDGSYTYTFAADLDKAAVPFDATLTHRIGFEIRGLAETTGNAVYTFRPSDGATSGFFNRDIVKDAACNACHDKLSLHGGARFETKYCVLCHNPGSTDANSGNTLDFKVMIHKIHRGGNLPSVVSGGEYAIWGFGNTKHDYSHVKLPQDIRNCRACHDEKDAATPAAGKWLTAPSKEACGSCHDNINFETGQNHSLENIPVKNADCTICHKRGGFVGAVDRSHALLEIEEAAKFKFNILNITNTSPGEFPQITFSVTNPASNDAAYNIKSDAPFQGGSSVAIYIAWRTTDYSNTGSGSPPTPASTVSLNPLPSVGGAADNGNGTFTMTSTVAIPAGMTGSGMVSIGGRSVVDVNGDGTLERIAIKGATKFFAITDAVPSARRAVVSIDKCNACHKTLSLHGAGRTDNIDQCLGCHNANNTDINRRPISPSVPLDGKKEESIDFKRMIHALHAGADGVGIVVYGFGNPTPTAHDFRALEFPGNLNKCSQCHLDETYYPAGTGVLATTIDTGADRADPLDDTKITPTTSVCSACHNAPLSIEHMKQNGGAFDAVVQAADGTLTSAAAAGVVIETCGVCHGKGKLADVKNVHHIE